MIFVVLNKTTSYNGQADEINHFLITYSQVIKLGDFKLDQRNHNVGEIMEVNMTMPFRKPSNDTSRLYWKSGLYCTDFNICGTYEPYYITMPW